MRQFFRSRWVWLTALLVFTGVLIFASWDRGIAIDYDGTGYLCTVPDDGTAADAYSTALYVMGEQEAVSFWRAHGGFELILITADGRLLYTPGLSDAITKPEDCAYDFQLLTAQPAA